MSTSADSAVVLVNLSKVVTRRLGLIADDPQNASRYGLTEILEVAKQLPGPELIAKLFGAVEGLYDKDGENYMNFCPLFDAYLTLTQPDSAERKRVEFMLTGLLGWSRYDHAIVSAAELFVKHGLTEHAVQIKDSLLRIANKPSSPAREHALFLLFKSGMEDLTNSTFDFDSIVLDHAPGGYRLSQVSRQLLAEADTKLIDAATKRVHSMKKETFICLLKELPLAEAKKLFIERVYQTAFEALDAARTMLGRADVGASECKALKSWVRSLSVPSEQIKKSIVELALDFMPMYAEGEERRRFAVDLLEQIPACEILPTLVQQFPNLVSSGSLTHVNHSHDVVELLSKHEEKAKFLPPVVEWLSVWGGNVEPILWKFIKLLMD